MNLFNLENNSDTPVDLGDVGEEKGYKCCVCNRKGSGRDFPPAENEKAICPECLDKRKKSGNTIPEEFVNKVFNEDCFEFIKRIPDNSISLCVVDPPFGDNAPYGRGAKEILNNHDESINYRFLDAIYPKMKDDSSLYIFSNHKFVDKIKRYAIEVCSHDYIYNMTNIMVKNNLGMGYCFRNQYEVCIVFDKKDPTYFLNNMSNVWFMKHVRHDEKNLKNVSKIETHPHQKEYDILRRIILHSSRPDEIVADFFGGSGSTFVSARRMGRKFIGCELDPHWFQLIEKNLQSETSKMNLF